MLVGLDFQSLCLGLWTILFISGLGHSPRPFRFGGAGRGVKVSAVVLLTEALAAPGFCVGSQSPQVTERRGFKALLVIHRLFT